MIPYNFLKNLTMPDIFYSRYNEEWCEPEDNEDDGIKWLEEY